VTVLWDRIGLNSRRFLATAAHWPAGQEFTFQDLAGEAGESVAQVKSWHRNLRRSMRHVDSARPEPVLLNKRWADDRNHYWLSQEVHLAIREQHPTKPPGRE